MTHHPFLSELLADVTLSEQRERARAERAEERLALALDVIEAAKVVLRRLESTELGDLEDALDAFEEGTT